MTALETMTMDCRIGCGACCIALSISSPIPGMPDGKPAGVRCVQLTPDNRCLLFGLPERPEVCVRLRPTREMCGETTEEALANLEELERLTAPDRTSHVHAHPRQSVAPAPGAGASPAVLP